MMITEMIGLYLRALPRRRRARRDQYTVALTMGARQSVVASRILAAVDMNYLPFLGHILFRSEEDRGKAVSHIQAAGKAFPSH